MKNGEGNVGLIRHITRRIDEFFDENRSEEFESLEQMQQMFSYWLRQKETGGRRLTKVAEGVIAQHVPAEEVLGEDSYTLGFIKLMDNGHVGVMWTPLIFGEAVQMPDELRDDLVKLLRMHADKLQDRSLDKRMQECSGNWIGAA